jgi:hypothetical protein
MIFSSYFPTLMSLGVKQNSWSTQAQERERGKKEGGRERGRGGGRKGGRKMH